MRTEWSDGRQMYKVVRPIPELPDLRPGDYVVVQPGKRLAAMWRELDSRYEVVLGATEGPGAALQGPIPFKDPGKDTPKPGKGTWEDEGEQWQGGSFNSDGTMRSEDWKRDSGVSPTEQQNAPQVEPSAQFSYNTETAAKREKEAKKYPTLDAWLEALARGKIRAPAPFGPPAYRLLCNSSEKKAREFMAKHEARVRRWPRMCKCGEVFTGSLTSSHRPRCPKCGGKGSA